MFIVDKLLLRGIYLFIYILFIYLVCALTLFVIIKSINLFSTLLTRLHSPRLVKKIKNKQTNILIKKLKINKQTTNL